MRTDEFTRLIVDRKIKVGDYIEYADSSNHLLCEIDKPPSLSSTDLYCKVVLSFSNSASLIGRNFYLCYNNLTYIDFK